MLQVAHRREHRDCVLLLRQPQPAGQPQAVGVRSELKSCTVGQQEAAVSSSSHPGNRDPHIEQAVAPDKGRTNRVCVSESCGAEDCRAGGAPKNVPGAPTPGGPPRDDTDTTTSEGRSCKEDSCDASVCAFQGVEDADWGRVVSKEQGKAWMHAAKAGDTPVLQQLLESNVALLAYRGQGTASGFGGARYCSVIIAVLEDPTDSSCALFCRKCCTSQSMDARDVLAVRPRHLLCS